MSERETSETRDTYERHPCGDGEGTPRYPFGFEDRNLCQDVHYNAILKKAVQAKRDRMRRGLDRAFNPSAHQPLPPQPQRAPAQPGPSISRGPGAPVAPVAPSGRSAPVSPGRPAARSRPAVGSPASPAVAGANPKPIAPSRGERRGVWGRLTDAFQHLQRLAAGLWDRMIAEQRDYREARQKADDYIHAHGIQIETPYEYGRLVDFYRRR